MTHRYLGTALLALALGLNAVVAQEQLPANAKVLQIVARPQVLELKHPFDYTQLLLSAKLENGDVLDVTRIAKIDGPASLIKVATTAPGLYRPVADGNGELSVSVGGQSLKIPVRVTGQKASHPVSFVKDVMPVLSKLGCNAGTCHGSAEGKNGFKLSLRGYDPLFDHRALTDDLEGRRFNRAAPERSLMLMKPAGAVPHAGGVLWQPNEPYYELIKSWIAGGVKLDLATTRVQSIELFPKDPVVPTIGNKQQFAVIAKYADGSSRDVTAESFVESSNSEVATIEKSGLMTTIRRGESTMLARYEGAYAASTVVVMGDRSGFQWKDTEAYNYIDELVYEKLKRVRVQPSELCTDSEFIRRVYLDLTGLPPQVDEVKAFLSDTRPTRIKRDAIIDKLVGSEAFIEHWTNKWADLLQVNRKFLGDQGAKSLREYIRKAVAENTPYDQFAYNVLTGTGSNVENPTASYFKVLRSPDLAMENTTHLFLAIRFNCNKCHDHPFERWTQDQYYSLASYFAQVSRTRDPKFPQNIGGSAVDGALPLVEIIQDSKAGEIQHVRTGENAKPSFPFLHHDLAPTTAPRRVQLAKWITSPQNPYFAKSYVNRVWSYLLGVGLIEPIDDIRAGNPATNAALLDRMTNEFIAGKFNVRELMKTICKSRTYQLSIKTNPWNQGDDINYSHALVRRLPAEVLFDAIHAATGAKTSIPGLPPGTRAAQLLDGTVEVPGAFFDLFGRPVRESACECERSNNLMLGPILSLVSGPVLHEAIRDPRNHLAEFAAKYKDDKEFIDAIYLSALARYPTPKEIESAKKALADGEIDHNALLVEFKKRQDALLNYEKQVDAKQPAWEKQFSQAPLWEPLTIAQANSPQKVKLSVNTNDRIIVASGPNPDKAIYEIVASSTLKGITGLRLEVFPDPALPAQGPGRAANGNFVLNELTVKSAPLDKLTELKPTKLQKPLATFSQDSFPIGNVIDGNPVTGWAVSPQFGKAQSAIFEFQQPITNEKGTHFTIQLSQQFGTMHTIGKFRLSVTTDKTPRLADGAPENLRKLLAIPVEKRTVAEKAELQRLHRSQDAEYQRLATAVGNPPSADKRITGAQDVMWALINNPAFLFNR